MAAFRCIFFGMKTTDLAIRATIAIVGLGAAGFTIVSFVNAVKDYVAVIVG